MKVCILGREADIFPSPLLCAVPCCPKILHVFLSYRDCLTADSLNLLGVDFPSLNSVSCLVVCCNLI